MNFTKALEYLYREGLLQCKNGDRASLEQAKWLFDQAEKIQNTRLVIHENEIWNEIAFLRRN